MKNSIRLKRYLCLIIITIFISTSFSFEVFAKGKSGRPSSSTKFSTHIKAPKSKSYKSSHKTTHARKISYAKKSTTHSSTKKTTYKNGLSNHRSEQAKKDFLKSKRLTRIPNGYQIDHIVPLSMGGSDTPSNMQLITIAEHHAKTKSEFKKYGWNKNK